ERHADKRALAGSCWSCKPRDIAGAAREAVAGTKQRAGNRAVEGACSNSKTGHTAIAWTCRHTSNCAERGQAGHTDHLAACCCETCDTAGAAPGCEADAAARGCASTFLTTPSSGDPGPPAAPPAC